MDFFEEWGRNLENAKYLYAFLSEKEYVNQIFLSGTGPEEEKACRVLSKVSIERLVDCICRLSPKKEFSVADIPMFSSLERSIIRVPELLEFADDGLSFDALGYQLMQCATQIAKKKYGENQSKTAALFSLVSITDTRPKMVHLTSLGKYLIPIPFPEKSEILRKLLLRNAYLHCLIHKAAKGKVRYADTVACVSQSTAVRRRGNVRELMEFVLKGTKKEQLLQHIEWEV